MGMLTIGTVLLVTFTASECAFIVIAKMGRNRPWMYGWRRLSGGGYAMVCFSLLIVDVIRTDYLSAAIFGALTIWSVLRLFNDSDRLLWGGDGGVREAAH